MTLHLEALVVALRCRPHHTNVDLAVVLSGPPVRGEAREAISIQAATFQNAIVEAVTLRAVRRRRWSLLSLVDAANTDLGASAGRGRDLPATPGAPPGLGD